MQMQALQTMNRVLGTINQQATEHALAWAEREGVPVESITREIERNPVGAWMRERLVAVVNSETIPIIQVEIKGTEDGKVQATCRPLA